jgi:hypothetical protein
MEKENHPEQGIVHHRIVSTAKKIQFVSDRVS